MAKFKYVIVSTDGIEVPRMGTVLEQHSDLVRYTDKVISGGFVAIHQDPITEEICFKCYGESISLKVKSRGDVDGDLIKKFYEFQI